MSLYALSGNSKINYWLLNALPIGFMLLIIFVDPFPSDNLLVCDLIMLNNSLCIYAVSSNSETDASELLENLQEMFSCFYWERNVDHKQMIV